MDDGGKWEKKVWEVADVIKERDSDIFNRITSDTGHVLYDLPSIKRNRVPREMGHDFILLKVIKVAVSH